MDVGEASTQRYGHSSGRETALKAEREELPGDWVTLNVGGQLVQTTRTTLTTDPNSVLARMFARESGGNHWSSDALARDASGAFLLDCDARYFLPVLNYLRRGSVCVDEGVAREGVLAEAIYFNVQGLIDMLAPPRNHILETEAALTWEDVGGLEGVKKELQQVVDQAVKYKDKFQKWGVGPSKNVLLYGPPGCGKTLLARVTANQINANFIWVKCPDLVTNGRQETVHEVLENELKRAKAMQPCIVFLEEFECIARVRGGDAVADGIISHLAIMLDGITAGWESVFVFAATNRPDSIETALLRPGRFDQLIYIPMPDTAAREAILRAALRKVALDSDVDLGYLADHTHGFSGADLKEICQRSCKFAIRESIQKASEMLVKKQHLEAAMAYARRSVTEEDVYRYAHFNRLLVQISNPSFSFPGHTPAPDQ